jgi:hypothetical protein
MAAADQLLGQIDNLFGLTDTRDLEPSATSPLAGVSRDLVAEIMRSIQPITPKYKPNLLSGRILVVEAGKQTPAGDNPPSMEVK